MANWQTAYSLTYTGQSNASAPGAGGTIGAGPGVGQPGNAAGPLIDVAGSIWSVSSGKLVSVNNGAFSVFTGPIKCPARIPLGSVTTQHGRIYGKAGDNSAALLHLRTTGALNSSDGLIMTLLSNNTLTIRNTSNQDVATGGSYTGPVTIDWEIRQPTSSEATSLGTATGQEVIQYKLYNGDNFAGSLSWGFTGIQKLPVGFASTGYIDLGDRLTSITSILIETEIPVVLTTLSVDQAASVTAGGLVMTFDVSGLAGSDTVAATLYFLEGQSSTPVSIKTASRTGNGTVTFGFYVPPDASPHWYSATVVINSVSQYSTTNYPATYTSGPIAGVPMPYRWPLVAVPTLAAIPAWAQSACGSPVGIAGDSRAASPTASAFQTVSGNGSLSLINGSVGGTGAADWSPSSASTNCPISGQSGKNMFTGLRDAVVAAGGKWIVVCYGTNDLQASDDPTYQKDFRDMVNGFVAAGLKVFIEPDDARVWPSNGMKTLLNHNYFMLSLVDNVNVFGGTYDKLNYWWQNVQSISTDGIHWTSYANRWIFTAMGWGEAVKLSVRAAATPGGGGSSLFNSGLLRIQ